MRTHVAGKRCWTLADDFRLMSWCGRYRIHVIAQRLGGQRKRYGVVDFATMLATVVDMEALLLQQYRGRRSQALSKSQWKGLDCASA